MDRFAVFLLMLVGTALLVQLVANGPEGVRRWFAAKFLGRP